VRSNGTGTREKPADDKMELIGWYSEIQTTMMAMVDDAKMVIKQAIMDGF
jgi:hypothetical protein